jgi:hypothetical protein
MLLKVASTAVWIAWNSRETTERMACLVQPLRTSENMSWPKVIAVAGLNGAPDFYEREYRVREQLTEWRYQ